MRYKQKNKRSRKFYALLAGGILLCAAAVVIVLELTNTTHFFHAKKVVAPHTADSNTKGETTTGSSQSSPQSSTSSGNGDTATNNKGQSDITVQPAQSIEDVTGNFVSDHHPASTGTTIQSVCQTTPGINCQISFTKDGITKTLAVQKTDDGGAAYWTWTPKSVGLTAGSWKVTATATSGSQSKSADDAIALEIP